MLKIYLSGYAHETEYRKYVIDNYGDRLNLFDPMKEVQAKIVDFDWESYLEGKLDMEDSILSKLVETEKAIIKYNCDIVVAYMMRYSAGTIMEIMHAYDHDIPVYIIDPSKKFRRDFWLKYHTNIFFDNIDSCFKHILSI